MSRKLARMDPSMLVAAVDSYLEVIPHWRPLKETLDIVLLNTLFRGRYLGGSETIGITVSADGDYDLPGWDPVSIDNLNTQISSFSDSNGASLIAQAIFRIKVSDAAINATPKLRYGAAFSDIAAAGTGTVGTISGALACAAISDDFTGANQYQTVTITLPSGVKLWKPQVTIAGTGGATYSVWAKALLDVFIQSTTS